LILSLEELSNLRILGLSVFIVDSNQRTHTEYKTFRYQLLDNDLLTISEEEKPNRRVTAHFGIMNTEKVKKHKEFLSRFQLSGDYHLFGTEEEAKYYALVGLHKRAKRYAQAKRSLLCGDR
jgi:hypothetical protein